MPNAVRTTTTTRPGLLAARSLLVSVPVTAIFLVVRLIRAHGATGFPVAGPPWSKAASGLRIYGSSYDGQFVYRLALDPFTRRMSDFGITLDLPAYRQQRIGTALLARLVADLPGVSVAWAIIAVNVIAVLAAGAVATILTAMSGRPLWWAAVLAVPANLPISLGRDLTEPLAWALVLLAVWAARSDRWFLAALALSGAVLTRETSLVVVAGLGLYAVFLLIRRGREALPRLWLLLPALIAVGWQIYLHHVWGNWPFLTGGGYNTGVPVLGPLTSLFSVDTGQGLAQTGLGVIAVVEHVVFVVLLVAVVVQWLRGTVTAPIGERIAWVLAALLALSLRRWGGDVAFLRAVYDGWSLSVLLLLSVPSVRGRGRWWTDGPLLAAGVVSAGVLVLYAVRI